MGGFSWNVTNEFTGNWKLDVVEHGTLVVQWLYLLHSRRACLPCIFHGNYSACCGIELKEVSERKLLSVVLETVPGL